MRFASASISRSSTASRALLTTTAVEVPTALTAIQFTTKVALDRLEERLKAGEKALPECVKRPGKLNKIWLARELGLPAWHHLRPFQERLDALVKEYGLTPRTLERYSFVDFRIAALNHCARQFAAADMKVARREIELRDFDAALDWAASQAPGQSARATFAMTTLAALVPEAVREDVLAHVTFAKALFHDWLENRDLPADPAAVLRLAVDRSGMLVREAGLKVGLTNRFLNGLIDKGRRPLSVHYSKIATTPTSGSWRPRRRWRTGPPARASKGCRHTDAGEPSAARPETTRSRSSSRPLAPSCAPSPTGT